MRCQALLFVLIFTATSPAWAKKPATSPSVAMQKLERLVGQWQCEAQQIHVGLDRFDLEYVDIVAYLEVTKAQETGNVTAVMQALPGDTESPFETTATMTYDPQRSIYVQYETTKDGADATLYSHGFDGDCITWRYDTSIKSRRVKSVADIGVEASYCLAEDARVLHVNYLLQLDGSEPFILLAARCDRQTD